MTDFTEILPKDVIKIIATNLGDISQLFSFSSVNRKLYSFFKADRDQIIKQGKIIKNGDATFFLSIEGDAYASGTNFFGELGFLERPDFGSFFTWTKTGPPGQKISRLLSQFDNTIAFCEDGVYACGSNIYGQLGLGNNARRIPWVKIGPSEKKISDVKIGNNKIFVRCEEAWYACGRNSYGELGTGDRKDRWEWVKIEVPGKIILELIPSIVHTFVRCEDAWYACGFAQIPSKTHLPDPMIEWIKINPPGKTILHFISKGFINGINNVCYEDGWYPQVDSETIFVRCEDGWYAKGDNEAGQLGTGDRKEVLDWIRIGPAGKNVLELYACNKQGKGITFVRCEDGWYGCGQDAGRYHEPGGPYQLQWTKIELPGKKIFELQSDNMTEIFVRCQDAWYSRGSNWGGRLGSGGLINRVDWIKVGPEGKKIHRLFTYNGIYALCEDGWYSCCLNTPDGQLARCDIWDRRKWMKVPLPIFENPIFLQDGQEPEEKQLKF